MSSWCLGVQDNVQVSNDKFIFAYGPGDWLLGQPADKSLGKVTGTGLKVLHASERKRCRAK